MNEQTDSTTSGSEETSATETFEDVDWDEIDAGVSRYSKLGIAWIGVLLLWLAGVSYEIYSRFIAETGQPEFPLVGTVNSVDWLWSITLLVMFYYGVLPLYRNPRMTRYYWKEFKRNKAAVISGLFLSVIFVVGAVGARILPEPRPTPGLQNQPPAWTSVESYVTGPQCPGGRSGSGANEVCHGSWQHPLGTTSSGEDILLTTIHGMEVSMQVGLIATFISITLAAVVGLTAAYSGGLVDEVLMRYVDIQMTFPTFFLFLLLAYTFSGSLFILICIFGFFGWGSSARIMRAEALQRRAEPYVKAARGAGASSRWTIRKHLLPNISNSIITAATLTIPSIILAEAAIAFLGLGDPSAASWGRLISDGRDQLRNAWWISTIPGIFLFFTILAFNFLGDALRDALDPRHGGSGE